ncbi:transcription initiation factor IIB [Maublancomyces gigas]|uniref:General transcription factor TFIIB n=1 Tax=Discina gigas TaxID=1032678 RepID=A0ABR3GGE5_9PEZI
MAQEASSALQTDRWEADYQVKTICPECKRYPANIVDEYASGDTVCADCGLVLGERIVDTRSEWRTFSSDEPSGADPCRVGEAANPLLNGAQLGTSIEFQSNNPKSTELQRAHKRSSGSEVNRVLLAAYAEIGAFCDVIHITQHVSTTAKTLFKLVHDNKALKNKPQAAVIAGCIFIACRQCAVPRTFTEIFALTRIPKKEIGRIFKLLEKFFTTHGVAKAISQAEPGKEVDTSHEYASTTATSSHLLMIRFCNVLNLGVKITSVAEELAKRVEDHDILSGRSTLTSSGAVIYMVSHLMGDEKAMKEVAGAVGVSQGTLRVAYKRLYEARDVIINPGLVERFGCDVRRLPQ